MREVGKGLDWRKMTGAGKEMRQVIVTGRIESNCEGLHLSS